MMRNIYYQRYKLICLLQQLTHEIHSNESDFLFNVVGTKDNKRLCAVVLQRRAVLSSVLVSEMMAVLPTRGI